MLGVRIPPGGLLPLYISLAKGIISMEQCCRYVLWFRDEEGRLKKPKYVNEIPVAAEEGDAAMDLVEKQTVVFRHQKWIRLPKTPEPEKTFLT